MAKKVMQRVFELIDEEDGEIREFLREVLKVERVHLANADTGVKEKLAAKLVDFARAARDQDPNSAD